MLLSRPARRRPSESQALDGVTVKERNNPELVQLPDNWMPWHQFQPWFAKEWQPGDHVAIVGMTGSGKTTFARQILKLRGYTVVFATKAKDDSLYKPLEQMGFVIRDEWDPGAWQETGERYVIFRPMRPGERPTRDVLERQAEAFREALLDVFVVGGWCCYFDEVRYLADDLGLARELNVLWLQGRSLNISMVASTQRPVAVPRNMFEQATWIITWRVSDKDDRYRTAEYTGELAPLVRVTAGRLPRHEFLAVKKYDDVAVRSRVEL